MNDMKLIYIALLLLIIDMYPVGLQAQHFNWKAGRDAWIMSQKTGSSEYEKFFAIGTWHVPGYTFTNSPEADEQAYRENAALFQKKSEPFNMFFVTPGTQKDYMADKIHILNPFSPMLHAYIDKIPGLPEGDDKDYYRSRAIKEHVNSPEFEQYLDAEIKKISENLPNKKYIYSHIDEIALGGVGKWAVPPSVGAKINSRLKKQDKNALVFVDLLGHCKGSTYFFEQNYLKEHGALPDNPPYELIDPEARNCKIPLLGFFQSHDGIPVYQFSNGEYSYTDYDFETLKSIWYENTRLIAQGYKNNGDVFGINAFRDYFAHPVLSGITVDALKAGLGEKTPVWIYFDGNGYARPPEMTPQEYINHVKCQIYTSIIHGATGILFWNDWRKTPEVFDTLLPMLKELNDNLPIVKLETKHWKAHDNLHIMIKESKDGQKYIIASNTSTTDVLSIDIPEVNKKELQPLEVYITSFK